MHNEYFVSGNIVKILYWKNSKLDFFLSIRITYIWKKYEKKFIIEAEF